MKPDEPDAQDMDWALDGVKLLNDTVRKFLDGDVPMRELHNAVLDDDDRRVLENAHAWYSRRVVSEASS